MTISKARKRFEELKNIVLEDKKVDIIEAYALLDFIEPYAKFGNKAFVEFETLLRSCTADKTITDEESKQLVQAINNMSAFLKTEAIIEWIFFGILGVVVVLAAATYLYFKLFGA